MDQFYMNMLADLRFIIPEIILTVTILVVIVADLLTTNRYVPSFLSLAGLLAAMGASIELYRVGEQSIFSGMMVIDSLGAFLKIFFTFSTAVIVILSIPSFKRAGEYHTLVLTVTLGMCLLASSSDILMIFLSLEMVSVPSYILAGFRKTDTKSNEAALKYLLYGAVSVGVLAYGFSLLYGLTGKTNVFDIQTVLAAKSGYGFTFYMAVLLIMAGIGYKWSMVPFHFWTPDVYQGAPTAVVTFFSVGPKVAGLAALIRFVLFALSVPLDVGKWEPLKDTDIPTLIAGLAALTMTVGNLAALPQTNIKRLLAYSSIAHGGYILMGLVLLNGQGLRALLFYVVVYLFMKFGAFLVVEAMSTKVKGYDLPAYQGLGFRSPLMAFAMTIFLISLTGLPPLGGFIAKVYLFSALINDKVYWLAVVAALNVVISLYYYFRIIKTMYFEQGTDTSRITVHPVHLGVTIFLMIPTIVLGVYWTPLIKLVNFSLALE